MMRSLYSGVSGLQNHQIRMDALGNNIANVNTIGFKSSRVTFQDALNQTMSGAAAPAADGTRGGINAMQIGLGMNVASVDVLQTQGNLQNTGKLTDCAIQGDGFFVLSDGTQQWYTRAGDFNVDTNGNLVYPANGLYVEGWMADNVGNLNTNTPVTNIQIPVGKIISPSATTKIQFGGELHPAINADLSYPDMTVTDANGNSATIHYNVVPTGFYQYTVTATSTTPGSQINGVPGGSFTWNMTVDPITNNILTPPALTNFTCTPPTGGLPGIAQTINVPWVGAGANASQFTDATTPGPVSVAVYHPVQPMVNTTKIYDSLGNAHTITTTITKVADNTWNWSAVNEQGIAMTNSNGVLTFDTNGNLTSGIPPAMTYTPPGASLLSIAPNFSAIRQVAEKPLTTDYISPTEITSPFQDGYPAGTLQSFKIDNTGIITGVFSNGQSMNLAQMGLANFNNPAGLVRDGDTIFEVSNNSGPAQIGAAGKNGRGLVTPGSLEMSNVDLSAEFTDMIVTERGFQSNSKVIQTSDEMLQELLTLKR